MKTRFITLISVFVLTFGIATQTLANEVEPHDFIADEIAAIEAMTGQSGLFVVSSQNIPAPPADNE